MTSKCASSKQSIMPKLVCGISRPWWWGTVFAKTHPVSQAQWKSWCAEVGVEYRCPEDIIDTMRRIGAAALIKYKAAKKIPDNILAPHTNTLQALDRK